MFSAYSVEVAEFPTKDASSFNYSRGKHREYPGTGNTQDKGASKFDQLDVDIGATHELYRRLALFCDPLKYDDKCVGALRGCSEDGEMFGSYFSISRSERAFERPAIIYI